MAMNGKDTVRVEIARDELWPDFSLTLKPTGDPEFSRVIAEVPADLFQRWQQASAQYSAIQEEIRAIFDPLDPWEQQSSREGRRSC